MFKAAGVLLIFMGGSLIAGRMNKIAERDLRLIDGWISFMRYVKGQIECFGVPIDKILSACDTALFTEIGYKKANVPGNLTELISECTLPDKETACLIFDYAKEFGRYYREEQLKRCNYYIVALEEKRKRESDKLPQRKRLNTTLWIAGSLAVGILLL